MLIGQGHVPTIFTRAKAKEITATWEDDGEWRIDEDEEGRCHIHILDLEDGEVIGSL